MLKMECFLSSIQGKARTMALSTFIQHEARRCNQWKEAKKGNRRHIAEKKKQNYSY